MVGKKKTFKKIVFSLIGAGFLVLGITLVLSWLDYVAILFKGVVGMLLAVLGLFILFIVRE